MANKSRKKKKIRAVEAKIKGETQKQKKKI